MLPQKFLLIDADVHHPRVDEKPAEVKAAKTAALPRAQAEAAERPGEGAQPASAEPDSRAAGAAVDSHAAAAAVESHATAE